MKGYLLAAKAHAGQTRKTGEPYLTHPLAVAKILADMRMESVPPGTADQPSAAAPAPAAEEPKKRGGLGGMLGGLKKMAEAAEKGNQGNSAPQRAVIMTTSVEMLKLTTDVETASVAIPAGFTEKK